MATAMRVWIMLYVIRFRKHYTVIESSVLMRVWGYIVAPDVWKTRSPEHAWVDV